jgi:hypothetical protein
MDKPIKIPKEVVTCPICGGQVVIEVNEIEEDYDKTWKAAEYGFSSTCETEPEGTDPGFNNWMNHHFQTPYVDWLPVDDKIGDWLINNYRFIEHQEFPTYTDSQGREHEEF